MVARHVVVDRRHQVGLAEPGRAVEEERVVGLARQLGDGERGTVRNPVSRPDDEAPEGLAGIERHRSGNDARILARGVRGALVDELDRLDLRGLAVKRGEQGLRVAALDPRPDRLRRRQQQGGPALCDHAQRIDPELDRRARKGAGEVAADARPEVGELVVARRGHGRRPYPCPGTPTGGLPANTEERFRAESRTVVVRILARPHEADLAAEEAQAGEDPRLSRADADPLRPGRDPPPARQGP